MTIEHRQFDLLYRSFVYWRRSGVIDDPVLRSVRSDARRAKENHYVIGKLLYPGLIEEKQIAWLRLASITGNEDAIEILQRAPIGKL